MRNLLKIWEKGSALLWAYVCLGVAGLGPTSTHISSSYQPRETCLLPPGHSYKHERNSPKCSPSLASPVQIQVKTTKISLCMLCHRFSLLLLFHPFKKHAHTSWTAHLPIQCCPCERLMQRGRVFHNMSPEVRSVWLRWTHRLSTYFFHAEIFIFLKIPYYSVSLPWNFPPLASLE